MTVEPEVWMVQWTYDGEVWVDAHADEPRARGQARDRSGECLPMVREASYAAAQAEIERLRLALEFYRDGFQFHTNPRYAGLEWKPTETLLDDCGNVAREALLSSQGTQS